MELQVRDEFLEAVALRVDAHVSAQSAPEPCRWLNVESAADYLDTTAEAVRGLVKREHENRFPSTGVGADSCLTGASWMRGSEAPD